MKEKNIFFLIRIKNIIYLKCAHAYSSGTAYGYTYNFKIKLFFFSPRRKSFWLITNLDNANYIGWNLRGIQWIKT